MKEPDGDDLFYLLLFIAGYDYRNREMELKFFDVRENLGYPYVAKFGIIYNDKVIRIYVNRYKGIFVIRYKNAFYQIELSKAGFLRLLECIIETMEKGT